MPNTPKTGARVLAEVLALWDAGPIFHIPGEGILELVDALADEAGRGIELVSCRHEGGMTYMAQAVGRLRQRPGICLAARAPGALNACLALHTAHTDSAPLIMIVGQASSRVSGRDPLLGPDFLNVFAPMAKWVAEITDAARIPELMARAWHTAISGRPGPVVLVIAEDVLAAEIAPPPIPARPTKPIAQATTLDINRMRNLLAGASRPMLVAGGSDWDQNACDALARLAERLDLPVVTAYRRRDIIAHDHPCFVGELGIAADRGLTEAVAKADLLLVLGMRLGEINTFGGSSFEGFTLLSVPQPQQTLIHVHPAMEELNRAYQATLSVCASPNPVVDALLDNPLPGATEWSAWRSSLRAGREAFTVGGACPGPVDLKAIFQALRAELPLDAMLTAGAGAYALWPQRYFAHPRYGTQMGPKSGAMGYGLAAAIGVAAAEPGRRVVAVAGDGCFMMHGEELATAVLHDLPVIVLVVNNGLYGAISSSQKRLFGRSVGTELSRIDFAAYARAVGAEGFVVERTDEFGPALRAAMACRGPSLIELRVNAEALKPA